jgi:hypothetical protein
VVTVGAAPEKSSAMVTSSDSRTPAISGRSGEHWEEGPQPRLAVKRNDEISSVGGTRIEGGGSS